MPILRRFLRVRSMVDMVFDMRLGPSNCCQVVEVCRKWRLDRLLDRESWYYLSTRFFLLQSLKPHSIEPIHPIIMIIRSCFRCSRNSVRPLSRGRAQQGRPLRKYTTSSASASTPSPPQSSFSMLGSVTSELDKLSPRFELEPSQILILKSPSEFYETLKVRCCPIEHLSMANPLSCCTIGPPTDDDEVG